MIKSLFAFTKSLGSAARTGSQRDDLRLGQECVSQGEAQITARMIGAIKETSLQRYHEGEMKRFNQAKGLGCFDAEFEIAADLPTELQQGIFALEQTFPAKIRFANASKADDAKKDFRGMSIKLFDVPGSSLWGSSGQQDFVLNSYPALFAANPADFLDFIEAARDKKVWRYFIKLSHLYSLKIVLKGRQKITSPFAINYWSTTPYRLGMSESTAVKYSVRPSLGGNAQPATTKHENFLSEAMAERLKLGPVSFDFMVQFQQDPTSMPVENAAVIWDEEKSPFIKVATITIKDQPFGLPGNVSTCEAMTFNPWQCLPAHQPLGGINRVRKAVYAELADFRRTQNEPRSEK